MIRIASGVTDQYVYFDGGQTGLSSFTVTRSRNGAAAATMTTPTINETSSSLLPGTYELLLDEDMTIGAGNETEAMVFHVSAGGMAPVKILVELFLPYSVSVAAIKAKTDLLAFTSGNVKADVVKVAGGANLNTDGTGSQKYGE